MQDQTLRNAPQRCRDPVTAFLLTQGKAALEMASGKSLSGSGTRVALVRGVPSALRDPGEEFDVILLPYGVGSADSLEATLRSARSALAPGGSVFVALSPSSSAAVNLPLLACLTGFPLCDPAPVSESAITLFHLRA